MAAICEKLPPRTAIKPVWALPTMPPKNGAVIAIARAQPPWPTMRVWRDEKRNSKNRLDTRSW
jgi:hypothetical protein